VKQSSAGVLLPLAGSRGELDFARHVGADKFLHSIRKGTVVVVNTPLLQVAVKLFGQPDVELSQRGVLW